MSFERQPDISLRIVNYLLEISELICKCMFKFSGIRMLLTLYLIVSSYFFPFDFACLFVLFVVLFVFETGFLRVVLEPVQALCRTG